jgi:mersacidin/lichenicidin family type 2 lantibiotic
VTQDQVIRAWKDPAYRSRLSETELRALPANPAGLVELSESEMMEVSGGTTTVCIVTVVVTLTLLLRSDTPQKTQNTVSNTTQ